MTALAYDALKPSGWPMAALILTSRVSGAGLFVALLLVPTAALCATSLQQDATPFAAAVMPPSGQDRSLIAVPLHTPSRVDRLPDGTYLYQDSATSFAATIIGPEVEVQLDDATHRIAIEIDGERRAVLDRPGLASFRLAGLSAAAHAVKVTILSEPKATPGRLIGVLATGLPPLADVEPRQKIEFIGDSITAGYGNLGSGQCSDAEVFATTDAGFAFPSLVGSALNADIRVFAISGRGVVRNYNGGIRSPSLSDAYDVRASADGADWWPDAVVIGLGTNDYSTDIRAGEVWADQGQLRAAFVARYAALARSIRHRHARAQIVLTAYEGGGRSFQREIAAVHAELRRGGDDRVSILTFPRVDHSGCNNHPDAAEDEILARAVQHQLVGLRRFADEDQSGAARDR